MYKNVAKCCSLVLKIFTESDSTTLSVNLIPSFMYTLFSKLHFQTIRHPNRVKFKYVQLIFMNLKSLIRKPIIIEGSTSERVPQKSTLMLYTVVSGMTSRVTWYMSFIPQVNQSKVIDVFVFKILHYYIDIFTV